MIVTRKTKKSAAPPSARQKKRLGLLRLRGRVFILFFLVPICLIIAASLLYLWQLSTLSSDLATGSAETITRTTEGMVTERAKEVASQCKVYLITHPELKKAFFNYDLKL